jgi:hypothetical protein
MLMFAEPLVWLLFWTFPIPVDGVGYNIALSATAGDVWLTLIVAMSVSILKRTDELPSWINSEAYHLICVIISMGMSAAFIIAGHGIHDFSGALHTFVVVPVFAYALATCLPVALTKGEGQEQIVVLGCIAGWAILLLADMQLGLLAQHEWFLRYGFQFPR